MAVPYSVCLSSPVKLKEGTSVFDLEEALTAGGTLCLQYHLTRASPELFSKAIDASREAALRGERLLAVARRLVVPQAADVHPSHPWPSIEEDGQPNNKVAIEPSKPPQHDEQAVHESPNSQADQHKQPHGGVLPLLETSTRDTLNDKMTVILHQLSSFRKEIDQLSTFKKEICVFGSRREVVISDLFALEVSILDWFVNYFGNQLLSVEAKSMICRGKGSDNAISFYSAWWFTINEVEAAEDINFNIYKYWSKKLPCYQASEELILWADLQSVTESYTIGTPESQNVAKDVLKVLALAANSMVDQYQVEAINVSSQHLIDSLGFFISVLRVERNEHVHFVENLIAWLKAEVKKKKEQRQKKQQQRRQEQWRQDKKRQRVHEAGTTIPLVKNPRFPYKVDLTNVNQGMKCLNFMREMRDLEQEWEPVKVNIQWFSAALVHECERAIEEGKVALLARKGAH
ncbi:hypothetical protein GOP47_0011983 [Adiantum capillus-veneris]|uniref:Uncharacterized protein n=1 Tax=Adiantum capillus-veneris TaxID=13818 RepID=A0A9D4UUH5_ADICA|nr:hypothetical protein GOP47_0011983 [Adiantum capillus-veneris]